MCIVCQQETYSPQLMDLVSELEDVLCSNSKMYPTSYSPPPSKLHPPHSFLLSRKWFPWSCTKTILCILPASKQLRNKLRCWGLCKVLVRGPTIRHQELHPLQHNTRSIHHTHTFTLQNTTTRNQEHSKQPISAASFY